MPGICRSNCWRTTHVDNPSRYPISGHTIRSGTSSKCGDFFAWAATPWYCSRTWKSCSWNDSVFEKTDCCGWAVQNAEGEEATEIGEPEYQVAECHQKGSLQHALTTGESRQETHIYTMNFKWYIQIHWAVRNRFNKARVLDSSWFF